MKKFYSVLFFISIFFALHADAQRTVTIVGDSCLGSTVTAQVRNGVPKVIKWWLNDSILQQVRSTWASPIVVAGGNGHGSAPNQFVDPMGIFIDKELNLYVVDNLRVQRWDYKAKSGVTVAGGNGKGTALNQFYSAHSVCVDSAKNVYVSDALANRVVKWAPGATTGVVVAGSNGGGSGLNQLFAPLGICMDKQGFLYIADRWNDRIMKWYPGAAAGVVVAGGNGRGAADNQLYEPSSVAVDEFRNVYVSNVLSDKVLKWAPGAVTGVVVAGGNGAGKNANQFNNPSSIQVDSAGNIYILDNGNYRIQRWSPASSYGITVAGGNGYGPGPNKLSSSFGMCIDQFSNVYASEIFEDRVVKFRTTQRADSNYVPPYTGMYKAETVFGNGGIVSSQAKKIIEVPQRPQIKGPQNVTDGQTNIKYWVTNASPDATYNWSVPADAIITSGQGTAEIRVTWGTTDGYISVNGHNACGSTLPKNKVVYSTPAGKAARDITLTSETRLYPNPAKSNLFITYNSLVKQRITISLKDAAGRIMLQKQQVVMAGTNNLDISLSKLSAGNYFVQFYNEDRLTLTKMISVQ